MNLRDLRKEHYENADILVDSIQRREIAFKTDKGKWWRANHFTSVEKLREFLVARKGISSVYASSARYLDPNVFAPSGRGLIEAELIIDVDIKPEGNRLDWLFDVCFKTKRIADILESELGISKDIMTLDFSGGKGFHITVKDSEYASLTKSERKHLYHYLTGFKVSTSTLDVSKGGWGGRFKKHLASLFGMLSDDKKSNESILLALGIAKTAAKKISDLASDPTVRKDLTQGRLKVLSDKEVDALKNHFLKNEKDLYECVDGLVIANLHGILRLPGTIHGGTGFTSVRLEFDDLDYPERIIEKVKSAGGLDEVEILLIETATEDFDRVKVWESGSHAVPRWLALHLLHQ